MRVRALLPRFVLFLCLFALPFAVTAKDRDNLRSKWKLEKVAPGHCTGEPAFLRLQKAFGDDYLYAGAGTTLEIP